MVWFADASVSTLGATAPSTYDTDAIDACAPDMAQHNNIAQNIIAICRT
jgi:hypothetical protein